MRLGARVILGIALFAVAAVLFGPHLILRMRVAGKDFKSFAESKAGEFLKAKVSIDNIDVGFLNQVALKGLEIAPEESSSRPYEVRVEQIVFQYDLFKLVSQNLNTPSAVVLTTHNLILQGKQFPYAFFRDLNGAGPESGFSVLRLSGGEIRSEFPVLNAPLRVFDIEGTLKPDRKGRIHLNLSADTQGAVSGHVRLEGWVDPIGQTHHLTLEFDSVTLDSQVPLPFDALRGKLLWENDNLILDEVKTAVRGWASKISGSIRHLGAEPVIEMDWQVGKKDEGVHWSFLADFAGGTLRGELTPFQRTPYTFEGTLIRQGSRVSVEPLRVKENYEGRAQVDFASGNLDFELEKESQRLGARVNLKDLNFTSHVQLDHVLIYGLDLATAATFRFIPVGAPEDNAPWRFRAFFETDYFVLEYAPFHDLKGQFLIDPSGIRDISASWGSVFHAEGGIDFGDKGPESRLTVKIDGFDIQDIREFASRPLPDNLRGILQGKLKIEGPLMRPEVIGNLTIRDGRIKKLEYDLAIVRFRGFPPYLPLDDSRILKGRTSLDLKGVFDLSLPNVLHGIRIESADQFVIWRGMELSASHKEGDLELDSGLGKLPTFAFKAGLERNDATATADTENPRDDSYVVVGPKIKF